MKEKKVILKLRGVTKEFEEGQVLKSTDLDIYEGEFVTLLGPSGCGKTTTLRIIAGFEEATTGQVLIEEQDVTSLPPYKRNVNTVFQNYALFPHMNIFKNVSYSLVEKKISKKEIKERVTKLLEMVQLGKMEGNGRRINCPVGKNNALQLQEHWQMNRRFFYWMSHWQH